MGKYDSIIAGFVLAVLILICLLTSVRVTAQTANGYIQQQMNGCTIPTDPACKVLLPRNEIDYSALDQGIKMLNQGKEAMNATQSQAEKQTNSFTLN